VQAALAAYVREAYCDGEAVDGDERVIRCALEAAAPVLAEAVAQRILAHMEAHGPRDAGMADSLGGTLRRAWHRHFGIAARVAALTFSTPEDIRRDAAAALNRGDFAACCLDDAGNPVAGERED
jgi:hypothetical protein